ncbi:MAG: M23 family metallopeptidase [Verrucomicrobiota bacterium]
MFHRFFRRATFAALLIVAGSLSAQVPFRFPTANRVLYEPGNELGFFVPTSSDRPWTTGSFGCVRTDGWQMHEGVDIRSLQHDKRGEPTDPVLATAAGEVMHINAKAGLSNYGKYIVLRHVIEGLEIYSLYAHLSEIAPGVKVGKAVNAGDVIGTMGHTSNTSERIGKERAHVHFELNVLMNDNFSAWFKKNLPGERNDHGVWNGQNLNGLDPCDVLLAEKPGAKKFSLLEFMRSQTELCRVTVRATNFSYLKRYAPLVLNNPKADKEGVAGYEIAINYNGVPFALLPRAATEIKGAGKIQLLSVNETEYRAHPCRKLVIQHGAHWQLTEKGLREFGLLTY